MNEITLIEETMTSLQFAELTGTEHKHVLAKIRKLLIDLNIQPDDIASCSGQYTDRKGEQRTMMKLNRDLSLTLAGQYEPKIAYAVAQAFNKANKPMTQLESARALVASLERAEQLAITVASQFETIKEDAVLTEKSETYYTVKQLRTLVSKPSGKVLARVSEAMGYEVKQVFSQYDGMASNSYHVDVVNAVHGADL